MAIPPLGNRWPSGPTDIGPQIWIGEQHIGDDQLYGLERSGGLDPLPRKSVARLDLIGRRAFMAEEETAAQKHSSNSL